jgi:hypothetical protein
MNETRQLLLSTLHKIDEKLQAGLMDSDYGLCNEIEVFLISRNSSYDTAAILERAEKRQVMRRVRAEFKELYQDWPEYSGDPVYPVHVGYASAKREFEDCSISHWYNTEYGMARQRLLAWCIAQLESETAS